MVFLFVRSLLIAVVRFLLLLGILFFYVNFEVSPLPAWSLNVFVFLLQFVLTYVLARLAFGNRLPTWRELTIVMVLFLIGEIALEGLFYLRMTGTKSWTLIFSGYGWRQIALTSWYAFAVYFAYCHSRKRFLKATLPEGLSA